jgi:hypothetical protein
VLVKGNAGQGINRQLPHLGNAGQGINRQLPHLGDAGQGIFDIMQALSDRLRNVRICCGDWQRVMGESVTSKNGLTAIVLDPPYLSADTAGDLYRTDSATVAHDVREWALANGDNPLLRIALCGYDGEHAMPGWSEVPWKAKGGYGGQGNGDNVNAARERIWFSPHCLGARQQGLF